MPLDTPGTRRLLLVVAGVAAAMLAAPTAATALSCAGHPHASPRSIAEGTDELAVDATFREHYDGAIFGTIVSRTTQNDADRPDYGRTEVVVDVTGTFGSEVGSRAVVVQDDPGDYNGYDFEVGTHYFIPYVENQKGTYSHVCDPIAEVDPADVPELVDVAKDNAWASSANDGSGGPDQVAGSTDGDARSASDGEPASPSGIEAASGWALLGLLAAVLGAGLWARRERRRVRGCARPR